MDRLSCLPDELIHQILGSLPTKLSVVQTSVLSKRWRFLWHHISFLEFDFDKSVCAANSGIINEIVLEHTHDVHTFHLHGYSLDFSAEEFESWIVNIFTRNIRNLVIHLMGYPFQFPQSLFTCQTLVDFELVFFGDRDIPLSGIYFPALKKLTLGGAQFVSVSHESLARLLSGCPVLEEFSFVGMVLGQFSVSSSTLTRLLLQLKEDEMTFGLTLELLDTPALRYLQLHCSVYCEFSVGALDSLIEADVNLYWDESIQDTLLYSRNVLALVGKLHNVEVLRLVTGPIKTIYGPAFFALGIDFHNLTNLDLSCYLGFVTAFLENANNLRVLKLEIQDIYSSYYWVTVNIDYQCEWMEPKRVPACLSSHLQTVNFSYFGCSEGELNMTSYILMNAKVLKRMEISTRELDLKKKFEALRWLELFGRGSQECELVFD